MDTIKRLGEQETLNRIVTGTLKSYVDHDIDSVDTSQFLNLETLNVPKAESVVIGEGVKDTIEVLNAPKMEEVTVDSGEKNLVVNWGKCGGNEDVVVTFKEGDPLWIPKTFFTQAPMRTDTSGVNSTTPDIGYIGKFRYRYPDDGQYYCGIVYRLPQVFGKWLYDNAESGDAYGSTSKFYMNLWKGIAIYPDTTSNWGSTNGWGIAIRKGSEIGIMKKDSSGVIPTGYNYDITSEPFYQYINADDYYLVAEDNDSGGNIFAISGMLDVFGDNTIYFRQWNKMDSTPSENSKGTKYTCPSSLCSPILNNDLSNLPNLKVADVHTMDVDVPMFKGCTNLERATVGGTDKIESGMEVEWGEGQGGTVAYKEGEPIWIPKSFIDKFAVDSKLVEQPWDKKVGYQGIATVTSGKVIYIYKLPYNIGKYLYNNAEDSTSENGIYGTVASDSMFYKGIAYYTDVAMSDNSRLKWCGFGIRIKEDIGKYLKGQSGGSMPSLSLEDDTYYLVAECKTSPTTTGSFITGTSVNSIEAHLTFMNKEQIYLRHWNHLSSVPSITDDNRYYMPSGYTYISHPTLDSSYFEGCDNLKEVTITNPELRIGDAIPKTMKVNWGKCGGDEDVIVEYKEGEPLHVPKNFLYRTSIVGKDEVGLIDYSNKALNAGNLCIYRLPQELGKWLYDNAESVTEEHPIAYGGDNDYSKFWKGIATYPDLEDSGITASIWTDNSYSNAWGVGIRTGADLKDPNGCRSFNYDGTLASAQDTISDTTKALLNDNDYYLVLESAYENSSWRSSNSMGKMLYEAKGPIYFRHWNTLPSAPNGTTVMGAKYTTPSELLPHINVYADESKVPVEAQPLVVNWGKCGGEDDVIVTYNMGEGLWIPKAFITQAYTSTSSGCTPNADNLDTSVGYKTWVSKNDASTSTRSERASMNDYFYVIYKLPQDLGEYLHKNAENYTNGCYIGESIGSGGNTRRAYNGIALYSDTVTNWAVDSYGGPEHWGVGIRTKSTLKYIGLSSDLKTPTTDGGGGENHWDAIDGIPQIKALEDDAYYMIIQCMNRSSSNNFVKYGVNSWIELFGDGNIYFRHFNTMTTAPSATNKGEKYTCPSELCRPQKNVYYSKTKKKDTLTVNWGKCGGNEDVITTYKEGDGIWIPKDFLTLGKTMSQLVSYTEDKLDTEVGYKTWFCSDDYNTTAYTKTERSETRSYWINVYKLPQELGEYLYKNAEDNLGEHIDYSTDTSASDPMARNYKGIAFYPDTVNYWTSSAQWGVGIRKKEDLCVVGYKIVNDKMTPVKETLLGSIACIENFSQYKKLEDDAYYLVAQASKDASWDNYALNPVSGFFGNEKIYLRHWNTMTEKPSSTKQGTKYTVTSELLPPLQITMAEYLEENNPNYDFRMK